MDIDRINSNQAVCNRLAEVIPFENVRSGWIKPFYKSLCDLGLYWSYNYVPGGVMQDNSCCLVNKSHPQISSNMTEKILYEKLRACGLREKKTLKLMLILKSHGLALSFSSPEKDEGVIFYNGDFCIFPSEVKGEIVFPLLFSYQEWIEITRETNLDFDNMEQRKRHKLIFNTIRHNTIIYDEMSNVTEYGALARKVGEAVIKKYPVLRHEVLNYWKRKEKKGEVINIDNGRLTRPKDVLCGMDSLRKDVGEYVYSHSGLVGRC
jgi:hypothetical protein